MKRSWDEYQALLDGIIEPLTDEEKEIAMLESWLGESNG